MCPLRLPPISVMLAQLGRGPRSPLSPRSLDAQRRHSEATDSHERDPTPGDHRDPIPRQHDNPAVDRWLPSTSHPYNRGSFDNLTRGRSSSQSEASFIEGPSSSSRSLTPTMTMSVHDEDYGDSSRTGTSSSVSSPPSSKRKRSGSSDRADRGQAVPSQERERQLTTRSRLEVFFTSASGLGVALNAESMKRLKYCLTWLYWAIEHIDSQITFLRDFTVSLQQQYFEPVGEEGVGISPTTPTQASTNRPTRHRHHSRTSSASISEEHHRKLNDVRQDVVQTIRQVVGVVSKYAGEAALPEPARRHVKSFILMLPRRWAEAVRVRGGSGASASGSGAMPPPSGGGGNGGSVHAAASGRAGSDRRHHGIRFRDRGVSSAATSPASSRATSPAASPRIPLRGIHESVGGAGSSGGPNESTSGTMSPSSAMATAQKVLALATESLDMMKNVTGVVKNSLDAADEWVETMRRYGVQRRSQVEGEIPMDDRPSPPPPHEGSQSYFSGEYSRNYEYRDGDALSPLNLSRRASTEGFTLPPLDSPYSTHSTLAGTGSTPGTPGFTALKVPPYSSGGKPTDILGSDVRGSMGRMSLIDGDTLVKREDESEKVMEKMDVDG